MNFDRRRHLLFGGLAAMVALRANPASGFSLVEGRTSQNLQFVAGGIGLEESEQMKALASDYSLTVIIASRSGAYLADALISIRDARGRSVLDTQLSSPYLLVQLDPGRYEIEATHHGQRQRRQIRVDTDSHDRVVFGFDVPADQSLD